MMGNANRCTVSKKLIIKQDGSKSLPNRYRAGTQGFFLKQYKVFKITRYFLLAIDKGVNKYRNSATLDIVNKYRNSATLDIVNKYRNSATLDIVLVWSSYRTSDIQNVPYTVVFL